MSADGQPAFVYFEDDPKSCKLIRLMMKAVLGYSDVTIFSDSEDFWKKVKSLPKVPDVIFLDIHIRPHDGFEMLKMLRADEQYKGAKIIAMTASVMIDEIEQLKKAGFDGLIAKPIIQKIFPELVKKILDGEPVWYVA